MALAALISTPASASGVNLSWNDCGTSGIEHRTFACNTNEGYETLVVSFEPSQTMVDFVGTDVRIDLCTPAPTFPDWWRMFNSGSCRQLSIHTNADFTGGPATCVDVWAGEGAGGIGSYNISGRNASLLAFWAVATPRAVTPGNEYYAMKFVINRQRTTGTDSCAGCESGMQLVLSIVALAGAQGNYQTLEWLRDRQHVYWQTGNFLNCFTPAHRPTWGAIKSLYR